MSKAPGFELVGFSYPTGLQDENMHRIYMDLSMSKFHFLNFKLNIKLAFKSSLKNF